MVPTAIVALSIAVSGDSLTPAQIRSFYPDLFPCSGVIADSVVAANPLGPFVRRTAWFYQAYLRYGHPRALVGPGCQERLQSDSTFDASVFPALVTYLRQQGYSVPSAPVPPAVRSVRWQEAMLVASRFFFPFELRPDGRPHSYICAAQNGARDLVPRDLALEAFVYSAIWMSMERDTATVVRALERTVDRIIARGRIPQDSSARVVYYRQQVYEEMARDTTLARVLRDEYRRFGVYLPFTIREQS